MWGFMTWNVAHLQDQTYSRRMTRSPILSHLAESGNSAMMGSTWEQLIAFLIKGYTMPQGLQFSAGGETSAHVCVAGSKRPIAITYVDDFHSSCDSSYTLTTSPD
jgi:hypothetical protein